MSGAVFGRVYSSAYDALYGDKDYEAECDLLECAFGRYADGQVRSVLDLGCGTGAHAVRLAQRGFDVTGVDLSAEMLAQAQQKAEAAVYSAGGPSPRFHRGDIRSLHLSESFDAVVMMFAVLGYQLSNDDVLATLRCARRHLRSGGVLVFDVWYGPGVASIGPAQRVKVVHTDARRLIRVADAELDERHAICRVSYHLWDIEADRVVAEAEESHSVRYFYPMELDLLLEQSGLRLQRLAAFPDIATDVSKGSWNALVVATCPSLAQSR